MTEEKLDSEELARQRGDLLPDREAMSLIATDPQSLLGAAPAGGAAPLPDDPGGLASSGAQTAHGIPVPPADGTYDANESASSTT
jgi:hypothetical protein